VFGVVIIVLKVQIQRVQAHRTIIRPIKAAIGSFSIIVRQNNKVPKASTPKSHVVEFV
jgi:hypothetical protein